MKYIIPAILTATVLLAGFFAFSPIEQASTVHTTIIAATSGVACATESVTLSGAPDDDIITFNFADPIVLKSIFVEATTTFVAGDDEWGLDAITVDGNTFEFTAIADDAIDTGEELLMQMDLTSEITSQATLVITINDADVGGTAAELDGADVIDFVICGLTTDVANFNPTSGVT